MGCRQAFNIFWRLSADSRRTNRRRDDSRSASSRHLQANLPAAAQGTIDVNQTLVDLSACLCPKFLLSYEILQNDCIAIEIDIHILDRIFVLGDDDYQRTIGRIDAFLQIRTRSWFCRNVTMPFSTS